MELSNSAWASIASMVVLCTVAICLTIIVIKLGPSIIDKFKEL